MSPFFRALIVFFVLLAFCGSSEVEAADKYAAVAFSPSTGRYGFGRGFSTKAAAIEEATLRCGRQDAIVRWCRNSWIVLARSERTSRGYGYGCAWGKNFRDVRAQARANCLEHNEEAEVVVSISSFQ